MDVCQNRKIERLESDRLRKFYEARSLNRVTKNVDIEERIGKAVFSGMGM